MDYLAVAANAARSQAQRFAAEALAPVVTPPAIDSLTISADVMPHNYVARAVILDLQPSQMVAALIAVEDAIKMRHPYAVRTGWRACSDSLRVYFYSW